MRAWRWLWVRMPPRPKLLLDHGGAGPPATEARRCGSSQVCFFITDHLAAGGSLARPSTIARELRDAIANRDIRSALPSAVTTWRAVVWSPGWDTCAGCTRCGGGDPCRRNSSKFAETHRSSPRPLSRARPRAASGRIFARLSGPQRTRDVRLSFGALRHSTCCTRSFARPTSAACLAEGARARPSGLELRVPRRRALIHLRAGTRSTCAASHSSACSWWSTKVGRGNGLRLTCWARRTDLGDCSSIRALGDRALRSERDPAPQGVPRRHRHGRGARCHADRHRPVDNPEQRDAPAGTRLPGLGHGGRDLFPRRRRSLTQTTAPRVAARARALS